MPSKLFQLPFGNITTQSTGSFRDFVAGIQGAFQGAGFVLTNAVNRINTASVDPPSAANQVRGFDVYQFNDALQSTAPLFIRCDYRSLQSSTFNSHGMNVYIGERHDGSGSLSGLFGTSSITVGQADNGGLFNTLYTGSNVWTGENGNRLAIVMAPIASGSPYPQWWLNIARINDWNGQPTANGCVVHYGVGSGSNVTGRAGHAYHSLEYGKAYRMSLGAYPLLSLTTGSTPALSPAFVGKGSIEPNSPDIFFVHNLDSAYAFTSPNNPTGSVYNLIVYNQTGSYYRLPASIGNGGGLANFQYPQATPTSAFLLRVSP